jgi:phage FluMu gp28-like protein
LVYSSIALSFLLDFLVYQFFCNTTEKYQRCAIVASRQIGKTETLVKLVSSYALLVPGQLILVVSGGARQAKEFLKRVKRGIKYSPYKISLLTENATEIEFWNGSRIISLPNNPDTVRGYPANLLVIDEADSIWDWTEFKAALFPSVSRVKGKIVCSGTFKGKKQLYQLIAGEDGKPQTKWPSVTFPCWVNPSDDIEQQEHDLPPSVFAQEFECVPIDATGTMFPYELWDACGSKTPINIKDRKVSKNALYFGGWDVAELVDASPFIGLELPEDRQKVKLRTIENYHGMKYSSQVAEIKGLHDIFRYRKIAMDVTSVGRPPYEMLRDKIGSVVDPINFSANKKIEMANDFRIAVQDREIILPPVGSSREGDLLRKEAHDLNPQTLDHPVGGSSDFFWSACLAYHAYENNAFRLVSGYVDSGEKF